MTQFKNRVFGCVIVKSINSNYNADFSHQPRTLPNGVVYATDKALKYAVKNYMKDNYKDEKIFYFKRLRSNDFIPFSLIEAFTSMFPNLAEIKDAGTDKEKLKLKATKKQVSAALLECIDIKLFGATFAMKGASKEDNLALSIHGPVQINHGINLWKENNIYSEQIMSPFRNPKEKKQDSADDENQDKEATTLGRQSKLQEGHYLHHFSINPNNLSEVIKLTEDENLSLNDGNISILKDAFRKGVTYYDSASKAGTDNECLIWVKLKDTSKSVLPNLSSLIQEVKTKENDIQREIDLQKFENLINNNINEIEEVEIYLDENSIGFKDYIFGVKEDKAENNNISEEKETDKDLAVGIKFFDLISGKELKATKSTKANG